MGRSIEETGGDPYLELLSRAYCDQQAEATEILSTHSGSEAIQRLMEGAGARAERHARAALQISPPTEALACREGCEHCCFSTVGVTAPEAIHLAERLRTILSESELAALQERSGLAAEALQGMERGARLEARVPCALLRDGSCSAYEHRPLVCRWACSSSLDACLDHLVHRTKGYLEMEAVRYLPTQEVWRAKREVLREAGLDASLLALNSALAIALADPSTAQRYLGGEPVFEAVRLD